MDLAKNIFTLEQRSFTAASNFFVCLLHSLSKIKMEMKRGEIMFGTQQEFTN